MAVGPITGKALADHGATVIRVESSTRVDYVRTLTPFKDNEPGINRSHYYNNLNSSKLGVALNLQTPEGKQLAKRLIDWADVIVENFTPGTMKRLGFDYETLNKERPELIMISTCLLGQTGPWASFAGYGPHGAAISGLHYITGWPDRPPTGPVGPYTDVIAPRYSVSALAAAILERRRSGLGQHLDVSQVESAIHFIEPLVLDETVNGRTAQAAGPRFALGVPAQRLSRGAEPNATWLSPARRRSSGVLCARLRRWTHSPSARFDALSERIESARRDRRGVTRLDRHAGARRAGATPGRSGRAGSGRCSA